VLAQATFGVTRSDSVATYPYLHLVAGLPMLATEVQRALEGQPLSPVASDAPEGSPSRLYLHPTIGQYLRYRWCRGVR
jgi:phosphoribosylglycinamide formyltransferase 1